MEILFGVDDNISFCSYIPVPKSTMVEVDKHSTNDYTSQQTGAASDIQLYIHRVYKVRHSAIWFLCLQSRTFSYIVLVFTKPDIQLYIHCVYKVGHSIIQFIVFTSSDIQLCSSLCLKSQTFSYIVLVFTKSDIQLYSSLCLKVRTFSYIILVFTRSDIQLYSWWADLF